ncbi:DegT/DnrJ/EryC1/StrS family aminotransferase [Tsuneonella mangrovi]|uniref:DegT/DnrJ/EryC1/StrS family aminotransferase n=1 Tax=Tsuneonella mangrovi TaxID=1982042 RepID=UPI0023E8BD6D|nr:aminotransferase class I/II-fold pyridoxal phosphate-dependent enzyme [Tsuneonella mangrovi]
MRIWLSRPHMGGTEQDHVAEAFASNFIAPLGPQLDAFERKFEEYLGGGVHCAGLSSGSAALHLALHMQDLRPGDEVWVSSMTFAGGVFPILYEQATPVFFDLSPTSWTVDPDLLGEALADAAKGGRLPKAIVPTDLYGQSCDIAAIEPLAAQYGVRLIVDSAESAGARCGERMAGTGGDMAILSFNGNKIITTGGGGMLVSRDSKWIERARFLSTQARDPAPHYEHSVYGFNYRMGNVTAAIGIGQLDVLDQRVEQRRAIFQRYRDALGSYPGVTFMPEPNWSHSTRWLSVMTVDPAQAGITREDIRAGLLEHEIESRPMWKPMHTQPLFAGTRYFGSGFDERLFATGLCLPSDTSMSEVEQGEVIERIAAMFDRGHARS